LGFSKVFFNEIPNRKQVPTIIIPCYFRMSILEYNEMTNSAIIFGLNRYLGCKAASKESFSKNVLDFINISFDILAEMSNVINFLHGYSIMGKIGLIKKN